MKYIFATVKHIEISFAIWDILQGKSLSDKFLLKLTFDILITLKPGKCFSNMFYQMF